MSLKQKRNLPFLLIAATILITLVVVFGEFPILFYGF
jgi:hypothetical protein